MAEAPYTVQKYFKNDNSAVPAHSTDLLMAAVGPTWITRVTKQTGSDLENKPFLTRSILNFCELLKLRDSGNSRKMQSPAHKSLDFMSTMWVDICAWNLEGPFKNHPY